ncbi:carbohydrate-binding domain-containing protein [Butyrivibrio sp. MC2021]|uniref:carbohydrate-binding domain-containing protein n=1 Tax=Butyrivibrio sp. MC2021 TaxID=1408306 RepID=UPI00055BB31D|nr:carbohydrate-binding domain-containing protein [Butyrivibrio sp. MC2021]
MKRRNTFVAILFLGMALALGGCGQTAMAGSDNKTAQVTENETQAAAQDGSTVSATSEVYLSDSGSSAGSETLLDTDGMFSDRDMKQEADLTDASYITLQSGQDVTISVEGVYVISGEAQDSTIIVDADKAKVQLVLDGVTVVNSDAPAIYVKNADKVFVTTTDSENTLAVTGTFTADGDTNTDAVIYSKDDLVFNGKGTLDITSTANGISGKDDVKFTGGTYSITCNEDAIEANDSIRVCDGSFTIRSGKDALHSEDSDDTSKGFIYISGGSFDIDADGDGIQATTVLTIDGGTFNINASEGLEATYVQINDGTISIEAGDDGINASQKSNDVDVAIEINGGSLTINMASGDTDALDANGDLYINGGTVNITAQFAFDFDGKAELNGGTVTVNGEEVTEITNSMTFGGQGGFGGGNRPEMPEGFEEGDRPEMPEGFDKSNMPERPEGAGEGRSGRQMRGDRGSKQDNGGN